MMRPPGTLLIRLARAWFDEGTATRVFEPLIADWQREWADARTASPARRGWILATGLAAYLRTLLTCGGRDVFGVPAARNAVRFAIAFAVALAAGALAHVGPLFLAISRLSPMPWTPAALGRLVVEAAPLLVALAMLPAVAWLHRGALHRKGRTALQFTVLGALATLLIAGWLAPIANRPLIRQWMIEYEQHLDRESEARRLTLAHTVRALRPRTLDERMALELGMPGQRTLPGLWSLSGESTALGRDPLTTLALHRRLQWPVLAFVLGLLGWTLSAATKASPARLGLWWTLSSVLMFAATRVPTEVRFSVWGAWMPVAVFGVAVIALAVGGRSGRETTHAARAC
ncbi:MAG: hypothetical protein Q8L86_08080 [Vicinamibacterales bacterium]|nr:hypothetical protein [Vicinamibacterales bacterium]